MLVQSCIAGETIVNLVASVERGIREEKLAPGEKLPPIRTVASHLGVSPATVAGAYRQLQQRGFLVSQGRRGTAVSARPPLGLIAAPIRVRDGIVDCATGNPDRRLLPDLDAALKAVRREQTLYDADPNHPDLVRLGVAMFRENGIETDGISIVNGSLDGIERALAEVLRPGDRVAVEDPCFTGVLDLIRSRGLVPVPVEVDQSGIVPQSLREALALKPGALIVTPRAQNPTGAAFTAERIGELKGILAEFPELYVIEDDYVGAVSGVPYHGLFDSGRPRWAVVRSLCKALGPDLRIALVAGDAQTLANIQGRQVLGVRWVSHLLQDMAVYYLRDPQTLERLNDARDLYTQRRDALVKALQERGIAAWGRAGFNVWVPVPEEASVAQQLLQAGWMVTPGERFRLQSPPAIRVTTASLEESEAERLADAIAACLQNERGRVASV